MAERLLMIEDDRSLAEMVAEYLSAANMEVQIQADGHTGLELLRRETFDAVVLDIMLPDMDGFEVCRRIRAESDVPVLMLTARGDETDRIVGLELGADDYLPKPFNPRELLARLRAILRRRGATISIFPSFASAVWRSIAPPESSVSPERCAISPDTSSTCWWRWPRTRDECCHEST